MLKRINQLLAFVRRNERDVVYLYQFMTKYAQLLTGTSMINFGYWTDETKTIEQAQRALCTLTGNLAELDSAKKIIDVGSGFTAPADQWNSEYKFINNIICVDINYEALKRSQVTKSGYSFENKNQIQESSIKTNVTNSNHDGNYNGNIKSLVNATATYLPFSDSFADRLIALESAQHFTSFMQFIKESHRVLKKGGFIVIAIPVVTGKRTNAMSNKNMILATLRDIRVLGILSLTWASEHYELNQIKSIISAGHFVIKEIICIGQSVYGPLTDFYIKDRKEFRSIIMRQNSSFLKKLAIEIAERIIHRSALKMKQVSLSGDIDYVLIKAINE